MIEFTDFGFIWFTLGVAACGIIMGWVLAWSHYDKYGSVGAPFAKRDWPRKVPSEQSAQDVSAEQIRRMNEHSPTDYSKGNWVTETLDEKLRR